MKILKSVLVVLFGLQFTAIGIMKVIMPFFGFNMFLDNMAKLGYSHTGTIIVGLVDLLGGIALFFPKYRGYAIIVLTLLLSGGLGAHITAGDSLGTILGGAGFCLVGFAILFFIDKPFSIQDNRNNIKIS
jgi:DoxX-like family